MSILFPKAIVHNGNTSVTTRMELSNSINICDVPGNNFKEKAEYLTKNKLSTNFCIADLNNTNPDLKLIDQELYDISKNFNIIKVITSFLSDTCNLDNCWELEYYSKEKYLQNLSYGLVFADEILFLDQPDLELESRDRYIFSPGRSGSHVMRNLSDDSYKLQHHNQCPDTLQIIGLDNLINAEKLLSVMRKNLFEQIASDFITTLMPAIMNTTQKTLNQNIQIVKNTKPGTIDEEFCNYCFFQTLHFLNWFLLFKLVIKKDIKLYYLEDLIADKNNSNMINRRFIKNPYKKRDLIINYDEIKLYVDNNLQPLYNELLTKNY